MCDRRGRRLHAGKGRNRSNELQALGDEIVRMVADLRTKETELVRLRTCYDELAEELKGGNG